MKYTFIADILVKTSNRTLYTQGLSGKFADTAHITRIVYHRLLKFRIYKYQLSGTVHTQYDSMFLNID